MKVVENSSGYKRIKTLFYSHLFELENLLFIMKKIKI